MKPVDVHDKATRSKNMRAIGQRDTAIEKRLPRCSLRPDLRLPFRMRLPGRRILSCQSTAALSLPTAVSGITIVAICLKCPPRARRSGWIKLARTSRAIAAISCACGAGWRVLIVWECALRGRLKLSDEALTERLEEWICGGGHRAQIDTQGIGEPELTSPPHKA
jgi:DNA mismatch endonuclease (patch repair protein)